LKPAFRPFNALLKKETPPMHLAPSPSDAVCRKARDAADASEIGEADEKGWIGAAQGGDCAAFDRLCELHGDRLLQQAILLCGEPAWAEDLVQETLIAAWRSLHRFNGGCRFFTWLCSILIHRHGSGLRSRWRRMRRFLEPLVSTDADHPAAQVSAPVTQSVDPELTRVLVENLRRLPVKQREVVQLRFFAGESLAGIAAAAGISEGTVKSRLFHALKRLRAAKNLEIHRTP
jgi:RNA polymerase sigma-70 factor, ECF subfamily